MSNLGLRVSEQEDSRRTYQEDTKASRIESPRSVARRGVKPTFLGVFEPYWLVICLRSTLNTAHLPIAGCLRDRRGRDCSLPEPRVGSRWHSLRAVSGVAPPTTKRLLGPVQHPATAGHMLWLHHQWNPDVVFAVLKPNILNPP